MELHQLRYFVAVAECASFRRAAAHCHVAQPSLSQQIGKLETLLGKKLFDRLGRSIALTEAGRALLPRAKSILAEVREAAREVTQDIEVGRGPLAIGAIPTVAPYVLPPTLRRFVRAYPEAQLSIWEDLTEALLERVVAAELDVAFVSLPIDHPQIQTEELMSEPLLVLLRADDELAAQKAIELAALKVRAAVVLHEMHCLGEQIQTFCRGWGTGPKITCRTTQLSTVQQLVELGLGVSMAPKMCALSDRSKQRVYRPLADNTPSRTIVAVWRMGRQHSRLAERFVNEVRVTCGRFEES